VCGSAAIALSRRSLLPRLTWINTRRHARRNATLEPGSARFHLLLLHRTLSPRRHRTVRTLPEACRIGKASVRVRNAKSLRYIKRVPGTLPVHCLLSSPAAPRRLRTARRQSMPQASTLQKLQIVHTRGFIRRLVPARDLPSHDGERREARAVRHRHVARARRAHSADDR
jgi:hypothetical protein